MRKKTFSSACFLLTLLSSLNLCSAKFGAPITDDVSKLSLLKQNIPSDYEIPINYIPKEVAGTCWMILNIYPLEQSLGKLITMFGDPSSNKDNLVVFIAMLKSLRFTFDHEKMETAMQLFQCHYQEETLESGFYFTYIEDLLHTANQGATGVSCKPPPCPEHWLADGHEGSYRYSWSKRTPLILVLIFFTVCVSVIVWQIKSGRRFPVCGTSNGQTANPDAIPTVSVSIPLQTLAHAASSPPAGAAV